MDRGAQRQIVRLGGLALSPHRQLLDGAVPVPIGGKALELLSVLAEAEGALVTKDELIASVWPDVIVEENALHVHIASARKAMGGEAVRLVTVHGRGYWLRIDETPSEAGPPPAASVAVLAFANLTGDPGKEYLVDGIATELIATLGRSADLRVSSRTSSFSYRDRAVDVREIGAQLGVAHVVEGSVRFAGETLRVSAQLIDAGEGHTIWVRNFDRPLGDVFALQDDVARAIAEALTVELAPPREEIDPEAYDLYLQGRALARQAMPESLTAAIDHHERALARAPRFASAWTGLAGTLLTAVAVGHLPLERRTDARARAATAIKLDPEAASPHAILGAIDANAGRWVAAHEALHTAFRLNPHEALAVETFAWHVLGPCGHLRSARETTARAASMASEFANMHLAAARSALYDGKIPAAKRFLDMAELLGAGHRYAPLAARGLIAEAEGDFDAAAEAMAAAFATTPVLEEAGMAAAARAYFDARAGKSDPEQTSSALTAAFEASEMEGGVWRYPNVPGLLIRWQAMLGAFDAAFALADRMVEQWRATGWLPVYGMPHLWNRQLSAFRADPRFSALVETLGMPAYWDRHGPPDGYRWAGGRLVAA